VTAEVVNRAGLTRPLEVLVSSPQVDAVVLISSLAAPHTLRREEAEIRRVVEAATKPILVYSYTNPGPASVEALAGLGLAWYPSPARAARAVQVLVAAGKRD
jgi:hypothetical protein